MEGRAQPVLKFLGVTLLVATLLMVGYVIGVISTNPAGPSTGEMVYGLVTETQASPRVVCIRAQADVCAELFRGEPPPAGVQVRGWLVELPYDSDTSDDDMVWAFVTVIGTG